MTNRLPEKLTALRKHFGYSQGDMAEKLVVPVAEYMNWENGNTICRIDQLRQLARIYRVPIEDLADNTGGFRRQPHCQERCCTAAGTGFPK